MDVGKICAKSECSFTKLLANLVKIGNDKNHLENIGYLQLAVIMMKTTNGRQLTFFARHPKFFIISNLFRP